MVVKSIKPNTKIIFEPLNPKGFNGETLTSVNVEPSQNVYTKLKISLSEITKINEKLTDIVSCNNNNNLKLVYVNFIFNILNKTEDKYNITLYTTKGVELAMVYINHLKQHINHENFHQYFIICLSIAQKVINNNFNNSSYIQLFKNTFHKDNSTPQIEFNNYELSVLKLLGKIYEP